MAARDDPTPDGEAETVSMDVAITADHTQITVTGDRDAAVVVRSASGERIYLPPEDFDRPPGGREQSPYDGPGRSPVSADSPYQSADSKDSPYQSVDQPEVTGLEPTADGFVIRHEEPVTDLQLLR